MREIHAKIHFYYDLWVALRSYFSDYITNTIILMRKILRSLFLIAGLLASCNAFAQPSGWSYSIPITIVENSGSNLYDIQFPITVNTMAFVAAGQMDSTGADIRFAYDCPGNDTIPFVVAAYMNTDTTKIYLGLDTLLANDTVTIFMFYGNPGATSTGNVGFMDGPHSSTDSVIPPSTNSVVSNSSRGFIFSPNVDILVTHFGKREPTGTQRYVTLWDVSTQQIIHQDQVSGPSATWSYQQLNGFIPLTAGTSYILSLFQGNGDGYYYGSSSQIGQHLTYGGSMRYCNSCTQNTYPTSTLNNYHYGVPDFWYVVPNIPSTLPSVTWGMPLTATAPADAIICQGDTVNVSGAATGGSGTYTYEWGPNYQLTDTAGSSTGVYPSTDTTYWIRAVDSWGCTSEETFNIDVNQIMATVNAGDATCSNGNDGTASAMGMGTGSVTYAWSTGATTDSISGLMPGTYTVSVTDSIGCTIVETATVGSTFMAPMPTVGIIASVICDNMAPSVLSGTPPGGAFGGPGVSGNMFDPAAAGAGTHNITYSITDSNGCTGADTAQAIVYAAPTSAYTYVASLLQVDFTDASTGGATGWSWDFGDGTTSFSQDPTHAFASAGTYYVCLTVTSPDGCFDEFCDSVNVVAVSVNEQLAGTVSIYPNPAKDDLQVRHDGGLSGEITVSLFNVIGDKVLENAWDASTNTAHTLRVQDLPNGTYLLQLSTEAGKYSQQVIIRR